MIRTSTVMIAVAWLGMPQIARADFDVDLRDGCPPGAREVRRDVAYASAADIAPYGGTQEKLTGPVPELDSALVPTSFVMAGSYTHYSPAMAAQRARIWEGSLMAHLNLATDRTWLDDDLSIGFTFIASGASVSSGDSVAMVPNAAPSEYGNLVLAVSLRGHGLTSIIDNGPPRLSALRHAWAFQVLGAIPPGSQDSAAAKQALTLEQWYPYDSYRYAPHWALGASAEWRMESIGCYAPFVHLRIGFVMNPNLDTKTGETDNVMFLAPQTLTLGVYPTARLAAMFQYGLLIYYSPAAPRRDDPLPGTNAVHRFRFATELPVGTVRVGAHLDLFRGATLYDGTVFGVYVSSGLVGGGNRL